MKLKHGEPVPIDCAAGPENCPAVGQVVPSEIAPETANCLPNLVFLPTSARDAQDGSISSLTPGHARNLSRCGFLDRLDLDAVLQLKKSTR
jgi:hypothetical protein